MASMYKDYGYQTEVQVDAHGYLLPAIRQILGKPSGPILDLGCGNGAIARALLSEGWDVYGADASESGIRLAEQVAPGRFHVLDITAGALTAELADKQFQTIISTEVIEHLYNPRGFFDFARRILVQAGGGRLVVSTPYHGYLKNLAIALVGKTDKHYTVLWDGGHIKFFSRKTLGQMLREQGFVVTGFAGAGRIRYLWKSMLVIAAI